VDWEIQKVLFFETGKADETHFRYRDQIPGSEKGASAKFGTLQDIDASVF